MKTSITIPKLMLLTGILFSGAMILNGCSKNDGLNAINDANANANNVAVPKPTAGILDRNLKITFAKDGNTDITAEFNLITFNFKATSALTGYADAWNDLFNVRGNWSMTAGYDKITINFPTNMLSQLAFMNREWIIAESSANIILISANGDGDEVRLTGK